MSLGRLPTYSLCLDCEGATRSCAPPAGARQPRRARRADAGRGRGRLGSASADPRTPHDHSLVQHWLPEQPCAAGNSAVRSTQLSIAKNVAGQRSRRRAAARSTLLAPQSSARARPSAHATRGPRSYVGAECSPAWRQRRGRRARTVCPGKSASSRPPSLASAAVAASLALYFTKPNLRRRSRITLTLTGRRSRITGRPRSRESSRPERRQHPLARHR